MSLAREAPRPFLTAQWLDLLMLNYTVDPALLLPHVPAGTTLDHWQGDAIVSVVGFRFVDTRVLGVGIPYHRDFTEVNLRFYVRRADPGGDRRAVVFIRELVPRVAIAWMARAIYNEPYRALSMRHLIDPRDQGRSVHYQWKEPSGWTGISARKRGDPKPVVPGSEAEFITEHYWGYTRQRDGGSIEYQVAHPSWLVWAADEPTVSGDVEATYGEAFGRVLRGAPRSAFIAQGSPITVFRPRRIT